MGWAWAERGLNMGCLEWHLTNPHCSPAPVADGSPDALSTYISPPPSGFPQSPFFRRCPLSICLNNHQVRNKPPNQSIQAACRHGNRVLHTSVRNHNHITQQLTLVRTGGSPPWGPPPRWRVAPPSFGLPYRANLAQLLTNKNWPGQVKSRSYDVIREQPPATLATKSCFPATWLAPLMQMIISELS